MATLYICQSETDKHQLGKGKQTGNESFAQECLQSSRCLCPTTASVQEAHCFAIFLCMFGWWSIHLVKYYYSWATYLCSSGTFVSEVTWKKYLPIIAHVQIVRTAVDLYLCTWCNVWTWACNWNLLTAKHSQALGMLSGVICSGSEWIFPFVALLEHFRNNDWLKIHCKSLPCTFNVWSGGGSVAWTGSVVSTAILLVVCRIFVLLCTLDQNTAIVVVVHFRILQ